MSNLLSQSHQFQSIAKFDTVLTYQLLLNIFMRIRQIGDPILREVSQPVAVETIANSEVIELITRMKNILNGIKSISAENGNALSAPQVGSLLRLIVLRIDGQFQTMINPKFKPTSDKTFEFEEECFSLYDQRAMLERYYHGEVHYLDEDGIRQVQQLQGENAGLVQHEIDHLDGVLFIDRLEQAGRKARSIDDLLADQPNRLRQVRKMMSYMVG